MTPCPTCGKPVDALRAPAAKVKAGKVVAYCSKECARAADTQPVAMPAETAVKVKAKRTPAAGVPTKRTPSGGVAIPAGATPDSGPVIEIIHEPASGVVTSAADARSTRIAPPQRAETSGAIEIADTGHIDDYVAPDRGRGKGVLVFLLVLLLACGAFAAWQLGYLDKLLHHDSSAAAARERPAPVALVQPRVEPAPPAAIQPADAMARATAVLRKQMTSDSARVQRLAASALARTGDAAAIAALVAQQATETSELARLDIAYAMARGGDQRGVDLLVAELGSPRRDVKAEAANQLARLGDKRGVATLAEYLEVSQLRLGAAEHLAPLADPRAIDVLDKIRKDPTAPGEHARATIALGMAGRADVADALEALLGDPRNDAFAAEALAALKKPSARPVLVKLLEYPSLRVEAARALRRLDPGLDAAPLLAPLVADLASGKDVEQVQAAEAVLLLVGDPAWSDRE
ncbi:MAG TPA: HEAT repeat domain-containing protein [Kofleriaceae bacterium]|nr:HEAT repeat domain-containing protein [Kofleriaceae bacterium]